MPIIARRTGYKEDDRCTGTSNGRLGSALALNTKRSYGRNTACQTIGSLPSPMYLRPVLKRLWNLLLILRSPMLRRLPKQIHHLDIGLTVYRDVMLQHLTNDPVVPREFDDARIVWA
jgi:hypothetical protein